MYTFICWHLRIFTLSYIQTFILSYIYTFTLSYFHSEVFSMCTANCFDSPFFLTCAKALLMEIDTVVKDTMTVG